MLVEFLKHVSLKDFVSKVIFTQTQIGGWISKNNTPLRLNKAGDENEYSLFFNKADDQSECTLFRQKGMYIQGQIFNFCR